MSNLRLCFGFKFADTKMRIPHRVLLLHKVAIVKGCQERGYGCETGLGE